MNETHVSAVFRRVYLWTVVGTVLWISALFLAPLMKNRLPVLSALVYAGFSPTCHQISQRCFHILGKPMAVCARCFGVYAGFLAGTLFFPLIRRRFPRPIPPAGIFLLVTLPIGLDTAANFLHVWNTPSPARFLLGLIWGTVLPYYFITGVSEFFLAMKHRKPLE